MADGAWLETFSSRRTPCLSKHGMVSCTQHAAAQAGQEILLTGGNAADAAVAAAAALTVCLPTNCGLGGDAFCLYYDAASKKVHSLNGSGRAPAALTLDRVTAEGWSTDNPWPRDHGHCITVPGAPAAFHDVITSFGNVSPSKVFAPAERLAREGVPITQGCAGGWARSVPLLKDAKNLNGGDMLNNGNSPKWGEVWKNIYLADVYKKLGIQGKKGFYEGRVAEAIVDTTKRNGGLMTLDDLASHVSTQEEPISVDYNGIRVWETPPNSQGLAALLALNIIKGFDLSVMEHNNTDYIHHVVEAFRMSFGSSLVHVADPAQVDIPIEKLLSEEYTNKLSSTISPSKSMKDIPGSPDVPANAADTVYVTTADRHGNACSLITSNYQGFGTGLVPEACGFTLQNRGKGFSLEKGHQNVVAPGKRPYNTIIPCMLTCPLTGDLLASYGVMGGFMQPQGHVQMLLNMDLYGMNPQQALDQPRFMLDPSTNKLLLEEGIDKRVAEELSNRGHDVVWPVKAVERQTFGRGHIITRGAWWSKKSKLNMDIDNDTSTWWGGTEPRGDGVVLGY